MGEFFDNIFSSPVNTVKAICLVAAIILGIVIIAIISGKAKRKKFKFEDLDLTYEKERQKILKENSVHFFFWEAIIFHMLRIKNPSKTIVILFRVILAVAALIAGFTFHYLAIYFVFEVVMYLYSVNKAKKVEDENGLSSIPNTNEFLDMYIPAVNNGQSVNMIMDRYVSQKKDPALTLWWQSPDRDEIDPPMEWEDVIKIYKNGYYSEQTGNVDSAEVYQKDIMKQMSYYNNFKEKIGEINPIKGCYYIFMPIILLLSWVNDPDFWSDLFGLADTLILCALLYAFTFFISDLHKETCNKLF